VKCQLSVILKRLGVTDRTHALIAAKSIDANVLVSARGLICK
jgi:hypothetical protein